MAVNLILFLYCMGNQAPKYTVSMYNTIPKILILIFPVKVWGSNPRRRTKLTLAYFKIEFTLLRIRSKWVHMNNYMCTNELKKFKIT